MEYTLPHSSSPIPPLLPDLEVEAGGNLHVVLVKPGTIVLENRPIPEPAANSILVKIMATGICGTDFSYYARGGVGSRRATGPLVLGHEAAGVVFKVGSGVTTVKPGDHVALEPALPCRHCRYCRAGQFNYCVHDGYLLPLLQLWFACPAANAVRIPLRLTWPEAGCVQPLAIAVQIARRAGSLTHRTVAVFGCGPLGLLCMAVAKAYGARKIIAFDISAPRVEFAQLYAAHAGFVPPQPPLRQEGEVEIDLLAWNDSMARTILAEVGEKGVDVVLEASGAESAMQLGISLLHPGGTFVAAGMGKSLTLFPSLELSAKELDVRGSLRYTTGCFEDAIDLLDRGEIDLKPIITATFPLARSEEAFKAVQDGSEIKVVVLSHE